MTATDTASNKRKRIDNQDKGEDGSTSDSTMTTKSTEVRNVTIENNCQPPPTSIVTQDTTVSGLTITTTMGKQLYEVQKTHFEKTMEAFMKRNMGLMPFCCEDEDADKFVDLALKKSILVCPQGMALQDFKMKLLTSCIKSNNILRARAQQAVKKQYNGTLKLRMCC